MDCEEMSKSRNCKCFVFFFYRGFFKKKQIKKQVGDFMVKKRKNIKHKGSNINRSSDKRKEKQ